MNKCGEMKVKENKGFTTADIVVSVSIIVIFIGLITSLFYNFYITTTVKNRNAIATNCLIDVIEEIKLMEYDEVENNSLELLIGTLEANKTIPDGYHITANIQKYNEMEGNQEKSDLIKILNVTVEYTIQDKIEKIEISTLITKKKE